METKIDWILVLTLINLSAALVNTWRIGNMYLDNQGDRKLR